MIGETTIGKFSASKSRIPLKRSRKSSLTFKRFKKTSSFPKKRIKNRTSYQSFAESTMNKVIKDFEIILI